ncbi:uncharacterized protein [Manis javanica]|uniref:uncharacterized protein isoform X8 n=1 Tax=Manis javanica TaxID=9974 RepID=UPI003C6CEAF6
MCFTFTRGTGSSLISLVGLLKCHQKTAGMIDECPSGNHPEVELLDFMDLHLCSTEPDVLCGFRSAPSLLSNPGHPSKAPVHGQLLCVLVARCPQDRKGTSVADDRLSSAPGLHRRGHAELPCSQRPGAPGAPALLWTVVCAQEDLLPAGAGHAEVGSRGGAGRKDAEPRKGGEACACPAPATLHAPRAQSGKLRWRWWRAPVSGAEDGETRYLRGPPEQAE